MIDEYKNMPDLSAQDQLDDLANRRDFRKNIEPCDLNQLQIQVMCAHYAGIDFADLAFVLDVQEVTCRSALSRGRKKARKYRESLATKI